MAAISEKSIFLQALDEESPEAREAFLENACAGDARLRASVNELLSAHELPDNPLDQPIARLKSGNGSPLDSTTALDERPIAEGPGTVIGPYRLMEQIGEGGFGLVFVADQQRPVRRRVALKVIKPGMDTRDIIARFEAERQALALMDHPNIARVLDVGTTDTGRPYFVMELVRGVPITQFCEQHQLDLRGRLELFVTVCNAVHHAHQKGVIHRDIKPSNVLVTLHDAIPVAKVIDFGVAKAIGQSLTEKTIYTRFAGMIGTPLYMSPEQAEMNGLDVDTRSDIYSLGVLLYELLSGTTPFDQRRLDTATFDELRRIIREEEPPRPSVRLTTMAKGARTVDVREPRARAAILRGELDWIVMKALEKDRQRRYDTAADLGQDIQRYLHDQPVAARPPSNWYRLSKFVSRNKVVFTTASLVLLSLIVGTAVSTWQAIRATRAQAEAETLRNDALEFADRLKEANVLLDSARANADQERYGLALAQYTRATELQPDHYLTWSGRGSLYARLGAWRAAAADFAKALELGAPANNPGWWGVPQLCLYAGDEKAYALACQTLRRQLDETDDPAFVTVAIRSLALRQTADAGSLAERIEQLLDRPPARREFRGPFPAGPPDRNRSVGPPPSGGEFPRPPGLPIELQLYSGGLAHYRAGEIEQARECLNQVLNSKTRQPFSRLVLPVLAMADFRSGQTAEAERRLSEAEGVLDEWTSTLATGDLSDLPVPWFDLIEFNLLYREAHELIRGAPPAVDHRLERFEANALASLQTE